MGMPMGMGAAPLPPPPVAYDQYGRPLPPMPPGAPPMPPQQQQHQHQQQQIMEPAAKRSRTPTTNNNSEPLQEGERHSYPVKKYRPDSYYRSIEAFQRYTKAHRMLDASYTRWTQGGGTAEKPIVMGIRIAGSFLSWGRGKTRDAAIDASIRAAFALVAAHGYDDFTCNDDCFTEEPFDRPEMAPIPPPPPPPPPGMMGMGMGMGMGGSAPPLPPGMPPPLPPGGMPPNFAAPPPGMGMGGMGVPPNFAAPPPPMEEMIPQPVAPNASLAVASAVVTTEGAGSVAATKLALGAAATKASAISTSSSVAKKKNSSGLVFAGDTVDGEGEELCMEEIRMQVPRYWTLVIRALAKRD